MKNIQLLLCLILTQACFAQFKLTKLNKTTVPKTIHYIGNIVEAIRWTDDTGDNIVLLTKTDVTQSKTARDDGSRESALYGYHFIISKDSARQTWRVYDYIKECPVDMILYFVEKAFAVTDLNKDGKAEVWIMYKVSCQGDVSPVPMKIILYQNNKKFAVRGTTKTQVSATDYMGGEFTFDEAFKNGPVQFRQYAEKLWKQHQLETWKQQ